MLKGKTILLGVTGSIAAYKTAYLASALKKCGANVIVLMTENAKQFISPVTFETLTGNRCLTDTFDRNFEFSVEHVSVAKQADLFLVAPASADIIAKVSMGIADDMLTTTFLACTCSKLIAPAMNTAMYNNPITQDNLKRCARFGMKIISPGEGLLACGDTGAGRMEEPEKLLEYIRLEIGASKDLEGMKVLVTAGPTREALDPVRFISNHSTGKMGYAVARQCAMRGAEVTLVSGPVALPAPVGVRLVDVVSARDMFEAVTSLSDEQDIIIKAAAVADYRPSTVAEDKIKKSEDGSAALLSFEKTDDILKYLGEHKRPGQFLCGFSMETANMVEGSRKKLVKKNLDMIVGNNLKVAGAGFGVDTNIVTIITPDSEEELPIMSKDEVAGAILDRIVAMRQR